MLDYKIPIVPNLNFEKNDENHYIFKIDEGNLKSKETGNICKIYNIEIDIYDKISIKFEMDDFFYPLFFMEEVPSEDGKRTFVRPNVIKFFDIMCDSEEYGITLLNFSSEKETHEIKKGISTNFISGKCREIVLLKNNTKINDDEKVNVWNVLECCNTSHITYMEFESDNLGKIYLKSKNTIDYPHNFETPEDLKTRRTFQENQMNSFNQLLGNDAFLFYESLYSEIDNEIIRNIDKLLMFYDSNIVPSRFLILQSVENNKLEIRIKSKNTYKLEGSSIFKDWPDNLFNFINSSYDSYIDVKNSEIDIDLLLHYYVWIKNEHYAEVKLMLCSEFFEVLKNNMLDPSKNEDGFIFNLSQRFNFLKLNTYKLLKLLQPEVLNVILNLENSYIDEGFSEKDVIKISRRYKNEFLLSCIKRYRNKIIHSGKFDLTNNDIGMIVGELTDTFKDNYSIDSQVELVEKFGNDITMGLNNADSLFNIFNQSLFLERIVEIVLLKIFSPDCLLSLSNNFGSDNSKDYVSKFIKM
ncbi:hypothetical protein [Methanobrevibacter sp. UBA212]|uniref:hypothetical protein n=1 Tax=Methanobrevibacter sp. UBA212 TaxID=1915476 RepID=UPI0025D4051D|nr:hypothetical protein [Methanobrevibacter sp. UBA212]